MKNVIYAYKKKSENKIVYIGQSVNLNERHYRHTKIDPFDETLKEYNYPLSKGIRKYGVDEYELITLEENVPKESLDEREKYWIAYYDTYNHGYNQTLGGNAELMPTIKYEDEIIDSIISDLKNTTLGFQQIADKYNVSLTHIYNINIGARRKRDNLIYPIRNKTTKGTRGIKFSQEECKEIHEYIINNPDKTFKDIAKKYSCSDWVIRNINQGKTQAYHLDNYNYPLRK